jgi:hypothetical protein
MAVIDRISQPCVPAHIDSHRAMVSTDTALDAAKRIRNNIAADECLAAVGARFDPVLYVHISVDFSTILTGTNDDILDIDYKP